MVEEIYTIHIQDITISCINSNHLSKAEMLQTHYYYHKQYVATPGLVRKSTTYLLSYLNYQ